jgi:hypothetical protein
MEKRLKSETSLKIYEFSILNNTKNNKLKVIAKNVEPITHNTECGLVSIDLSLQDKQDKEEDEKFIRSCDYLNIVSVLKTEENEYIDVNINDPKNKIYFEINGITSIDLIKFMGIFATKEEEKNINIVKIVKEKCISMKIIYNDYLNILNSLIKILTNENNDKKTYIKVLRPTKQNKLIIIGDLHGSYSSFIRFLLRFRYLNIMNEKCVLDYNYHIIFLGDIVDRGVYGYEILMIIYLLKIINPCNIHINNGNHENIFMNKQDGFYNELEIISKSYFFRNPSFMMEMINKIYELNHEAIIIQDANDKEKYIYLAHGGFPIDNIDDIKNINLDFKEQIINLNKTNINAIYLDKKMSDSIRWSDFHGVENTILNDYRNMDSAYIIGNDIIKQMKEIGIYLTIRGHQDSNYNTKIIKKGSNLNEGIISINDYMKNYDYSCFGFIHKITFDKEYNLMINKYSENNIIPVITISTNTDFNRNLIRDSYVLLSFENNDIEKDMCFKKDTYRENYIKKIIKETKNSNNVYKNKYLKYKNKYLLLKSNISLF